MPNEAIHPSVDVARVTETKNSSQRSLCVDKNNAGYYVHLLRNELRPVGINLLVVDERVESRGNPSIEKKKLFCVNEDSLDTVSKGAVITESQLRN